MAVTGQQVYDLALNLIDEVSTDNGDILHDSPDLETKAINALTILQTELLPKDTPPVVVTSLANDLLLDDRTCFTTLSYGLAAQLLISDNSNPSAAAYYNARYFENKSKRPSTITTITDNYNVLSGMQ